MPVYLKAAAGALPFAGRLPFFAGGGGDMPALQVGAEGLRADLPEVTEYSAVCGFRVRDELPPTYPHVLAFPLQMELMTDRRFPFTAVGLVHIGNRIAVRRPLRIGEELQLSVRTGGLREHPKGRAFSLISEVSVGGEPAWQEESTMLKRGGGEGGAAPGDDTAYEFVARWELPGDLGRRYASVSGDRNPIHMHALTARLFGFPRAIAHGMWTKARCLAALEPSLPDAYEVEVEFRKPILLPGTVDFERAGDLFRVRSEAGVHLLGRLSRG